MNENLLSVNDLYKSFQTDAGSVDVLKGVSFSLSKGSSASIVGPSGCGKSTLLYTLGTLENPTSGTVLIDQTDVGKLEEKSLAAFRNRNIGFVFQDHHLMPQLSVLENVLLPALATMSVDDKLRKRAEDLIDNVGLSHRKSHFPTQLSGGERQRVAVARSLILSPQLILADEPTGSLDEKNSDSIAELLIQVHKEQGGVLVCVTHNKEIAERFDCCLSMESGKLIN